MKGFILLFVSLGVWVAIARSQTQYTTTYQSYNPADGMMDLTQTISYELPDPATFGPGPYPVFVWIPGTGEPYNDPISNEFISQMILRGFVSASVQYSNAEN